MTPTKGIGKRVLDRLVSGGLVSPEQVASAQKAAASRQVSVGVVLAEWGLIRPLHVVAVLEHDMGVPQVDLSSYTPEAEALALVPAEVAIRWHVLPLFEIEGTLTAAITDPMDVFVLDAVGQDMGVEIEPVLADRASFTAAVSQYYPPEARTVDRSEGAPPGGSTAQPEVALAPESPQIADEYEEVLDETPSVLVAPDAELADPGSMAGRGAVRIEELPTAAAAAPGRPSVDLDVLAVADTRRVAALVVQILEDAVSRGASRIHLLPYKDEFFLVYRIRGSLEKVANAPVSLQPGLVEGFKQYVGLGDGPWSVPAFGRVRSRIADRDLVVTVSVVPTIAGQRVVVSLVAPKWSPRRLDDLGVLEAESRALKAMVERGCGILLVCAPLANGSSATYYALLEHAAATGRTVFSVEHTVEYEIASAAQVLVDPGGPAPAVFVAAGLRQDVDVIAIDPLSSVDDVQMVIEAAALGKLVIATIAAADIASGVKRMIDLGVEPHSLASALTLGVGQRLVRRNCPKCSIETDGVLASRIPGSEAGLQDKCGSGCPSCYDSGFQGAAAIYEVLPFTEPVRTVVSRSGTAEDIAGAAAASGMRPLLAAGLSLVKAGQVSADELNRVLRFAD